MQARGNVWAAGFGCALLGGCAGESGERASGQQPVACDPFESQGAGAAVVDLPTAAEAEYVAETGAGQRLLVVRPRDDWAYEDFRVFFGLPDAVVERQLVRLERQRDGGTTHVVFELPEGRADAFFPVEFDGMTFVPGPATLTIGATEGALTRLEPEALGSMKMLCTP